jgi:hypothetical protein
METKQLQLLLNLNYQNCQLNLMTILVFFELQNLFPELTIKLK